MSAFELGCVGERYESDSVTVSLQDSGVSVYANGGWHSMGGHATLTPDQARQLGHLLIRAADNHDELVARKAQIEAESAAFEARQRELIQGALGAVGVSSNHKENR